MASVGSTSSIGSRAQFAGDVIKLVSGTTFAQLVGVAITPILTRLYAPDAFGLMAIFVSVGSLLSIIACLRYEFAIPLPARDEDAAALLVLCVLLSILMASLTAAVVAVLGESISGWLNTPGMTPLLGWIPVFVGLSGLTMAFNYWNSRARFFGRISISNVMGAVTASGTKLVSGLAGFAHGGSLIAATMAGQTITTIFQGFHAIRHAGPLILRNTSPSRLTGMIVRYRKFPLFDVWGALLNSASWQIPTLMFATFFSPAIVGFYALAFRFIQLPMSLIGTSLGQAFYPRIASARASGESWSPLVLDVFSRLVALALFPALLFAAAGPHLFSSVFGTQWQESGVFAQILSLWVFWWFISSPLSLVFNALEKQDRLLIYHLLIFITRLASILIGSIWQDVHLALWLFSLTGAVVYGSLVIHILFLAKVPLIRAVQVTSPYLAASIPLGAAVFICGVVWSSPWITTMAAALAGLVYLVFALRRDHHLLELFTRKFAPKGALP